MNLEVINYYKKIWLPHYRSFIDVRLGEKTSEYIENYKFNNILSFETIDKDFTQSIKNLLNEVDNKNKTYFDIVIFTRIYQYLALKDYDIVIDEKRKDNKAFSRLFNDCDNEIDDLQHHNGKNSDTSREIINLYIDFVLEPEKVLNQYNTLNEINKNYIYSSDCLKNKIISDYLVKLLDEKTDQFLFFSTLIYFLAFQETKIDNKKFENILQNHRVESYYLISYLCKTKDIENFKAVVKLRPNLLEKEEQELLYLFLNEGKQQLLSVFINSNNLIMKQKIIESFWEYISEFNEFWETLYSLSKSNQNEYWKSKIYMIFRGHSLEKVYNILGKKIFAQLENLINEIGHK